MVAINFANSADGKPVIWWLLCNRIADCSTTVGLRSERLWQNGAGLLLNVAAAVRVKAVGEKRTVALEV